MSFDEKLERLDGILKRLESEPMPLDTALGALHGSLQELGVVREGLGPVFNVVFPHIILTAVQLCGDFLREILPVGSGRWHKMLNVPNLTENG